MRNLLRAIVALVGVALALMPVAAHAHYTELKHGNDYAYVYSGHNSGAVNDQECDGNEVWVELFIVTPTNSWVRKVSAVGCNHGVVSFTTDKDIFGYRICEAGNGCVPSRSNPDKLA